MKASNNVNQQDDGVTHINVYSQAKTVLGRSLSNFAHTPFTTKDGTFQSVESWWYWFKTKDDVYKNLIGFKAKQFYRANNTETNLSNPSIEELKEIYIAKLEQHPAIKEMLLANDLPFAHYYEFKGKKVNANDFLWTVQLWHDLYDDKPEKKTMTYVNGEWVDARTLTM